MDMKHLKAGATLALALALSACGGGAGSGGNGSASGNAGSAEAAADAAPANGDMRIEIANPGSDQLKGLGPLNQRIGLLRAIRQSGIRCPGVLTGRYQQQYQSLAMWVALCGNGKHYAVFIAPTEDVQVRDCAEHAQLNLPACQPTPPLPRDPQGPPGSEPDANAINAANANLAGE
jgi:hypothetical protein